MDTKELLEKARRDYPEGTKYVSAGGSPTIMILKPDKNTYRNLDGDIDAGIGMGYLYCSGIWAKIIKAVEIPVINNYSIY